MQRRKTAWLLMARVCLGAALIQWRAQFEMTVPGHYSYRAKNVSVRWCVTAKAHYQIVKGALTGIASLAGCCWLAKMLAISRPSCGPCDVAGPSG